MCGGGAGAGERKRISSDSGAIYSIGGAGIASSGVCRATEGTLRRTRMGRMAGVSTAANEAAPIEADGASSFASTVGQANCSAPVKCPFGVIGLEYPDCAQAAATNGASENTL